MVKDKILYVLNRILNGILDGMVFMAKAALIASFIYIAADLLVMNHSGKIVFTQCK